MFLSESENSGQAFARLYDKYSYGVNAYCVSVLRNRTVAEDVFQEVFINFHNYIKRGADVNNVKAFLLTTARNLCLNHIKARKSHIELDEFLTPGVYDRNVEDNELFDIIMRLIDTLDDMYKEAFILKEIDGLAYEEICAILDLTLPNAKSRVRRAKLKLVEALAPFLDDYKTRAKEKSQKSKRERL